MAGKWYVEKNGQVLGPLTTPQLRQRVAAGELAPGDKVRKEEMAQWVRAAAVKGLFDAVAPPTVSAGPPAEAMASPPARGGAGNPFDFFGRGATLPAVKGDSAESPTQELVSAFSFDELPAPAAPMAPPPVKRTKPPAPPPALPREEIIPSAQPVDEFAAVAIAESVPTALPLSAVKIDGPKPPPSAGAVIAEINTDEVTLTLYQNWLRGRSTAVDGKISETTMPLRRLDAVTVVDVGGERKLLTCMTGAMNLTVCAAADAIDRFANALFGQWG